MRKKFAIIIIIFTIIVLLLNYSNVLFAVNPKCSIELNYNIVGVKTYNLTEVYAKDLFFTQTIINDNVPVIHALCANIFSEKYTYVVLKLELENNTNKNVYDLSYCINKRNSLYKISYNSYQDSPVSRLIMPSAKLKESISFIIPKRLLDEESIEGIINNFEIQIKGCKYSAQGTVNE